MIIWSISGCHLLLGESAVRAKSSIVETLRWHLVNTTFWHNGNALLDSDCNELAFGAGVVFTASELPLIS